jgi:hypothetical protein
MQPYIILTTTNFSDSFCYNLASKAGSKGPSGTDLKLDIYLCLDDATAEPPKFLRCVVGLLMLDAAFWLGYRPPPQRRVVHH